MWSRRLRCFHSTTTISSRSFSSPPSLYARLMQVVDRRASVIPLLDEFTAAASAAAAPLHKSYFQGLVKELKRSKHHVHALQISMWMSDRRHFPLSPGDLSDRLILLYRVHGLDRAESYFDTIPKQMRVYQTYGALLKCFAEAQSVAKAESLFAEMKHLEMLSPFSYNVLMRLYSDTGHRDKLDTLYQEMHVNAVRPDAFTDSTLLEAYAAAANVTKMETVMKRIKRRGLADAHKYAVVARAYIKAGLDEKASAALIKSEKLLPRKNGRIARGFLITLYSDIGNKDEMHRIWNEYKSSPEKKVPNSLYMCMMSGLLKLNEVSDAEAKFEEWESEFTHYDLRVPSILVSGYCDKGLLRKAKALLWKIVHSGRMPFADSWARVAAGYFEVNHVAEAVKMATKAMEMGRTSWRPSPENVIAGLEYFAGRKDLRAAEDFARSVRRLVPLTRDVYLCLLRTFAAAGRPVADVLEQMKEDGFVVDDEVNKILRSIRIRLVS